MRMMARELVAPWGDLNLLRTRYMPKRNLPRVNRMAVMAEPIQTSVQAISTSGKIL